MSEEKMYIAEGKIAMMYILKKSQRALTYNVFLELVGNLTEINFFLFEELLQDLIREEYILEIENKLDSLDCRNTQQDQYKVAKKYILTSKGDQILNLSINILSGLKKLKIDSGFKTELKKLKDRKSVTADYKQENDGTFNVSLKIIELEQEEFSIKLNVYTKEDVQKIMNNWKNNTSEIYMQILNMLNKGE